jgi:hypothetical protein
LAICPEARTTKKDKYYERYEKFAAILLDKEQPEKGETQFTS